MALFILKGRTDSQASSTAEIDLDGPLPEGSSVGLKLNGLIETGELADVVYFERPGDARPNTESIIFLLEPDGEHAKRVKVKYGRQSGSLMEIISGLSPGDRVIVTDMSAWAANDRVRLK